MIFYVGVSTLLAGVYLLNIEGPKFQKERTIESLFLLSCAAIPMIILEVINSRVLFTTSRVTNISIKCLGYRYIGFIATSVTVIIFYWTLDEYHSSFISGIFNQDDRPSEVVDGQIKPRDHNNRPKYHNFFRIIGILLEILGRDGILAGFVVYIGLTELLLNSEKDGLYYTGEGLMFTTQKFFGFTTKRSGDCEIHSDKVVHHFLEIFVRCFFSPLMFTCLCDNLPMLHYKKRENGYIFFANFMDGYNYFNNLVFTVDLCFAFLGYALPVSRVTIFASPQTLIPPVPLRHHPLRHWAIISSLWKGLH